MVHILPFRGLRYNLEKVGSFDLVTAPPYDVIEADEQQALYDRHPANIVRLILNKKTLEDTAQNSMYTRAAGFLKQWKEEGVLQPEPEPAMFAYSQLWEHDGKTIERKGLIALLRLETFESKKVLPHEQTLGGPKVDRLNLMQATMTNLSQIFMIYGDPERLVENTVFAAPSQFKEQQTVTDKDGVQHRVHAITDKNLIQQIQSLFEAQNLLIADGHHRYETALNFREEVRKRLTESGNPPPPYGALLSDYVMVFLTNMDDPGLQVYPTHRMLMKWPEGWTRERFEEALLQRFDRLPAVSEADADFTYIATETTQPWPLKLKDPALMASVPSIMRTLDLAILDEAVFQGIFHQTADMLKNNKILRFYRDEALIDSMMQEKACVALFRMGVPSVPEVKAICEAGYRMPQKSTYFYPKILSGLVLYPYSSFGQNHDHALSGLSQEYQPIPPHLFSSGETSSLLSETLTTKR